MWQNLTDDSGIYCIFNIKTKKKYIGSAINLRDRIQTHQGDLRRKEHHSILLQRAWDKYGKENFKVKVLEIVKNKKNLVKREQFYIDKFKSYIPKNGYNIEPKAGSSLGVKRSEEFKKKIRLAHLGKKLSEETKRKIREANMGEKSHLYGKHPTKKTLKKMRVPKNIKDPFVCIENCKIYCNTGDAERELNIKSSNIIKCLKKTIRGITGYRFIFLKDIPQKEVKKAYKNKIVFKNKYNIYKIILKYLILLKNTGEIYLTIKEASQKNNIKISSLYHVLYGHRKSIFGKIFVRI